MRRGNVLIVEDEAYLQLYWEEVCEEEGIKVAATVGTVAEALSLLNNLRFSGVILDVTLQDGSSAPVAEALRKTLTPTFVCTGDPFKLPEAFRGFKILEKPVPYDKMVEAVHELAK